MIRRFFPALAALLFLVSGTIAAQDVSKENSGTEIVTEPVVVLSTVQGDIYLHFFPELAPEHVKNFIFHCKEGNYTGTYFHRVIPGFMIQGGDFNTKDNDPANDGMGGYSYMGPGTNLKAEFSSRKHTRGILSMARGRSVDSAGSQFFIMHKDYPSLDGKYTVFGEVIKGLDVVDKIVSTKTGKNNRPIENQTITGVEVLDWPTRKVAAYLLEQKSIEAKK